MANQPGPKGVVDLRPQHHQEQQSEQVFIDPRVDPRALADPRTAAYAAGLAARATTRAAEARGLPKYQQQVGGGPAPNIPLLDREAAAGMPMAMQAPQVNQDPQHQVLQQASAAIQPGSIVEPPLHIPQMNQQQAMHQAILNSIQPSDMLSQEAQGDPTFQQGGGAMFAANQPHLVLKYGLVRQGQHIPPQALARTRQPVQGQLSPQSLEGLQAIQEHQRRNADGLKPPAEPPPKVPAGAAGHSARAGAPSEKSDPAEKKPLTEEEKKQVKKAIEGMDSFDYDALQRQMEEDILNNPEQRKIIESRLEELDMDELITKNQVTQDVTIHTGEGKKPKLWYTFESMRGGWDLTLKQLIMQESKSIEVTGQYLLDKFAFMSIAMGLKAINGNVLPRHTDDKGEFNEDRFWIKFHWLLERPLHLISSIGINHTWFEERVRTMFKAEKLGNG